MSDNDEIQLPFRFGDFLSGAKSIISIIVVLVGLVAWTVNQQEKISYLETREKDHPTKQELAETAIRIDNRISELEKARINMIRRLDDLDRQGSRALADRVNLLEHNNRSQDEIQEIVRRLNDMQGEANKAIGGLATIIERQNVNTDAIKALQLRVSGYGGGSPNQNYNQHDTHPSK